MSIKQKIIFGFGLSILLVVAFFLVFFNTLDSFLENEKNLFEHPYEVRASAHRLGMKVLSIDSLIKELAQADSIENINNIEGLILLEQDSAKKEIDLIKERFLGEASDVEDFENLFNNWNPILENIINTKKQGNQEKALFLIKEQNKPHYERLKNSIVFFTSFAEERAEFFHEQSKKDSDTLLSLVFVVFFMTLFFCFIVYLLIVNKILGPLKELTEGAKIVGKGNLNHKIKIKKRDEMGELASSFNDMTEKLQNLYNTLDKKVKIRTKELEKTNEKLETINKFMIGREIKMAELKKKIKGNK
jgi:nitrate/nitrite-specific signal transduction histidine kinase